MIRKKRTKIVSAVIIGIIMILAIIFMLNNKETITTSKALEETSTARALNDPTTYTVRFVDWNGVELKKKTYRVDTTPVPPANPTRESSNGYIYEFKGWSPEIKKVTSDITYTATYTAYAGYTVRFEDWNGTLLKKQECKANSMPTPPSDPTRPDSNGYRYKFKGWSPEIRIVTSNITYIATYTGTKVPTNIETETTPTQTPKPVSLSLSVSCSDKDVYKNEKTITAKVNVTNGYASNAIIYINGNKVNNNNGIGTYKVNKNATYTVRATYGYIEDTKTIKVEKIDTEKPTFTSKVKQTPGTTETMLTIAASDAISGIKSIAVAGTTIKNASGEKEVSAEFPILKKGDYKIEVEDIAGNKYSDTIYCHVDTTAPKIQKMQVKKDDSETKITESDSCQVKVGDTVTVTMSAHENILSYGEILLNGKKYEAKDVSINGNILTFKIELTQEIVDKCGLNEYIDIKIIGLKDKFNNEGDFPREGTCSNEKKLFLDKVLPKIEKIEIIGGTRSKDNKVIEIYKNQKIKLVINTSERLSNKPSIDIGGYKAEAIYEKAVKIDNKTYSQYILIVNTNELIKIFKEQGKENSYIPIEISNYKDLVGNIGNKIIINEKNKSTNGVSLVYGKAITGELYFSVIGGTRDGSIGDINGDGLINSYDYLLLTRYLANQEELTENQLIYANADKRRGIEHQDLIELAKIIEETGKNVFCDGVTANFKVFNQENREVPVSKLDISILEGSNLATYSKNNENLAITANASEGEFLIEVVYQDDNEYEQQVGRMKFILKDTPETESVFAVLNGFNKYKVMGDLNKDGFATHLDEKIVQHAIVTEPISLTDEEKFLANLHEDYDSDGNIIINVKDGTAIGKIDEYTFRGMKRGDKISLQYNDKDFNTFDKINNATIKWETIPNTNSVTINPNNAVGSAEITINDNAKIGERLTVRCAVEKTSGTQDRDYIAEFNIEVVDEVKVDLSHKELVYDFSNLPEKNIMLKATTNVINREIKWSVVDESIAKIDIDEFGNAEVIPLKPGKTDIMATVEGKTAICKIDIIQPIKGLEVDKQEVELLEGETIDVKITKTPENSTEMPVVKTNNANIARVGRNGETGEYKIYGISEGNTKIIVSSPSKEEISKEIDVNVNKIVAPQLKTIRVGEDEEKTYKIGEEINIKFIFTKEVKGEAPRLKIRFGDYSSIGEPEFTGFEENNTIIAYKYIIQEGDNGVLIIESLEEGALTDVTGKTDAKLTINGEEEIVIEAVKADGIRPEIEIKGNIDNGNYWLTEGKEAKIKIVSSEELLQEPEVIMGGQKAEVEGYGTEFTASLKITKQIEEGYLKIEVGDYTDKAGNEGEEVIAIDENIDNPIRVDYTGTEISAIQLVKEKGKEYKAGDKFDIVVTFKDNSEDRLEQIVAEEAPKLNLKFGGVEAKGQMTNDYEKGEYRSYIVYTYTISDEDEGKISIDSITGKVTDRAENETDLSKQEYLPELTDFKTTNQKQEENENGDVNENGNSDGTKPSGKLPNAGKIAKMTLIIVAIASGVIGVPYIINKKKYRQV